MRTLASLKFLQEAQTYSFLYTCDTCNHFVASTFQHEAYCSFGYPLGERTQRVLEVGDSITFCKEYE